MSLTVPNVLTILRLFAAPCLGLFLIIDLGGKEKVIAIFIFFFAAMTDYLDGYLARLWDQKTVIGEILDPIADKAMVIISLSFISFTFDDYLSRIIYGIPTVVIIFREIFISGLREYDSGASKVLAVTKLSKMKTTVQLCSIGLLLIGDIQELNYLLIKELGLLTLWIASFITVITGIDYLKKVFFNGQGTKI